MSSGKLTKTFKEDFIANVGKKERVKWTQTEAYSRAKDIEAYFQARVDAIQEAQIPLTFRVETSKFRTTEQRTTSVLIIEREGKFVPKYWGSSGYSFNLIRCYVWGLHDESTNFAKSCLSRDEYVRDFIGGTYTQEDGTVISTEEFQPLLAEWYKIMDTMECEINLVKTAWRTILNSCNTINQLLEAAPDAEDYFPSYSNNTKPVSTERLEAAKNVLKASRG